MFILTNSFSINMLSGSMNVEFYKISLSMAVDLLKEYGFSSAVGHQDTANLFSNILDLDVPMNRSTVVLDQNTALIVGQYSGPRLPEGCTTLPDGARIIWWKVQPTVD